MPAHATRSILPLNVYAFYFLLILLAWVPLSTADNGTAPKIIAVLYPETVEPYRAVFAEIVKGIQQRLHEVDVRTYALSEPADPPRLKHWVERQQSPVSAVITLGYAATRAYEETGLKVPQIIGALNISPQTRPNASGITLSADPALMFSTLKLLAPKIKRVFVVFNPERDRWLMEQASQVAGNYLLTLMPLEATDLKSAGQHYLQVIQEANPEADALWLLADTQLIDIKAILSAIIEQSWRRRLVVFSNSLVHVDMGVLFALFPDNHALGRRLADMALRMTRQPDTRIGIELMHDVKRALNLRIGNHLDLPIDRKTELQFDLVLQRR